jgi:hypothetical protein
MELALVKTNEEIVLTDSLPDFIRKELIGRKKFVCAWTKQNGDFRSGSFDLKKRRKWTTAEGVEKIVSKNKPKRKVAEWVFDTYCMAFDLEKKDYRRITYNTIQYLEVGKIKYLVEVKVSDDLKKRAMELKPLNTIKSS